MQFLLLGLVVFGAAFLQATSGFGFALLAMPLATMVVGVDTAAPFVAAAGLVLYLLNSIRLYRSIHLGELARIGIAGLLGVPLGLWLQARLSPTLVHTLLGSVLVVYAIYALFKPDRLPVCRQSWAYLAGLAAGILGGAYNIPGPPVVVYGDLRAWPRDQYRSTLQAFFLGNGLLVVAGHILLDHYTRQTGLVLLLSIPAFIAGNILGVLVDRYLDQHRFRLIVGLLILLSGAMLLVSR